MSTQISFEDVIKIRRYAKIGFKRCTIASKVGCSEETVTKYATDVIGCFDRKALKDRLTETDHRRIVSMACYGMNYSEIARKIGCSQSCVSDHVKRARKHEVMMERAMSGHAFHRYHA